MLRCSAEAFARCPTRHLCGRREDATYTDGSECDLFNRKVAERPLARGEESPWVPVTERPPEEYGRYLCNVKSFAFPGRFYQAILHYDKCGFREGHIYTDDVTHWMPLPEPPEEVSNGQQT